MREDDKSREELVETIEILRARVASLERQLAGQSCVEMDPVRLSHYRATVDRIAGALVSTRRKARMLEEIRWTFDADRAVLLYPCDPAAVAVTGPTGASRPSVDEFGGPRIVIESSRQWKALCERALATPGAVTALCSEPEFEGAPAAEWFDIKSALAISIHPQEGEHPWLLMIQQCTHERLWSELEKKLLEDIVEAVKVPLGKLLADWERDQARYLPLFPTGEEE